MNSSTIYENLRVVEVKGQKYKHEIIEWIGYVEPRTQIPLLSLFGWIKEAGVKSIILEDEYVDQDFLDEFKDYYCTIFRDHEAKCKRLHFFSVSMDLESFVRNTLPMTPDSYLGFSVIRPILSFRIGRSVLKSDKDDGNREFTLCKANFDVNISGHSFTVEGVPFIQQDTNVGVCAQAALWMTGLYMHKRFSCPRFKPSQITRAATKYMTIGPVRQGLTKEQIIAALREMDYNPVVFKHYSTEETSRIIYAYVESEIPVIMLIMVPGGGGHAVIVIGHDFNLRPSASRRSNSNIEWIKRFFIHDDARGPYKELFIKKHKAEYSIEKNAVFTIVPIPEEVKLRADDVFSHVNYVMNIDILNLLMDGFQGAENYKFSLPELSNLIFRTYLCRSNDFKNKLSEPMSPLFRHVYRAMRMPRYVWVTEITKFTYLNKEKSGDRRILGEIVIDSTADRHARLNSFLSVHLLGRMIVKRPEHIGPSALYLDFSEEPYGHLVRSPRCDRENRTGEPARG